MIETGTLKLHKFYMFSFICRKIIVIGSKDYLKHIMNRYPYLDVKEFIDMNLFQDHRRIREVITRRNEFIVTSLMICDICNE